VADGQTVSRAQALGLAAESYLKRSDAYSFFAALDDLLMTGPTGTNVMDIYMVLVG
jgi:hydroxypyruvate reductase